MDVDRVPPHATFQPYSILGYRELWSARGANYTVKILMFIADRRFRSIMLSGLLGLMLTLDTSRNVLAQETMADAMAHAIARMMESMGFANPVISGSVGSPPAMGMPPLSNPMGMSAWPSAFGAWPGAQGSGTQAPANPAMQMPGGQQMNQMMDRFSQGLSMPGAAGGTPWGATVLEGIWEDNQGGLLLVQGNLYRIYSSCKGHIDGEIRVSTDRIELTNRTENFTQTFDFALSEGRLALRNQDGQIFLYRRLVLGQPR